MGNRPVVLLTRSGAYRYRNSVTVAPITRTIRGIPVKVPLDQNDGMSSRCVVNADDVLTIDVARLDRRIARLSIEKLSQLNRAVIFALALYEPSSDQQ